jgi:DNA polymerase zeta
MCDELSRMKSMSHGRFGRENDRWGFTQASAIRVTGRHMINVWRAMRGELNLSQYTLENVTFHLLHRRYGVSFSLVSLIIRVPHYAHADLTRWYQGRNRLRVFFYYTSRCLLDLEILEAQELVARVWSVPVSAALIRVVSKHGSLGLTFTLSLIGDLNSKSNR